MPPIPIDGRHICVLHIATQAIDKSEYPEDVTTDYDPDPEKFRQHA